MKTCFTIDEHTKVEFYKDEPEPEIVIESADGMLEIFGTSEDLKNFARSVYEQVEESPRKKLEVRLAEEKETKVDARDYMGWGDFDRGAYEKAEAVRLGRIALLEEMIDEITNKRG